MRGLTNGTRTIRRAGAATGMALAAALALAGPAEASFFVSVEEPAGDSTDPARADRDLTAGGIFYDRKTGSLRGAIRLAGAPTGAPTMAVLAAGTRGPQGCNVYPAVGFSADIATGDPRWHRFEAPGSGRSGPPSVRGTGQTVQAFEAQDDDLEGVTPNCAIITLGDPTNAATIYDAIGPVDLTALPDLTTEISGVPDVFRTGRSRQVTVTVRNGGDAASGPIRVHFKTERGVAVGPSRPTVKSIDPGGKRTVKVRVTPSSRAARLTDLTAIVKAGEFEARAETRIIHRPKPRPSTRGGGGGGGTGGGRVCTRWIPDFSGETGGYLGLVPC